MGFVKGKVVKVIKNAPLQDPVEYEIMGYNISLRRSEAKLIEVLPITEATLDTDQKFEGVIDLEQLPPTIQKKHKVIHVALVGNPNSGKTTLFNTASGAREHVGNYSGVTVDAKHGQFNYKGYTIKLTDLPGTYSLSAYSPEELYVRHHIIDENPDVVLNVVVASNLERNLYLTSQLIDMDLRMVVALNMYDELPKKNIHFDHEKMGELLGIPFIPTVSSRGEGLDELFDQIISIYEGENTIVKHIHINYGNDIEPEIQKIQDLIKASPKLNYKMSPRFLAIKLLEKDKDAQHIITESIHRQSLNETVEQSINKIERNMREDSEACIINAKYGFISGALKETYSEEKKETKQFTERIDTFITHRYLGIPIFIFLMWLIFQGTFTLGAYPQELLSNGVEWIRTLMQNILSPGMLKDLIIDGIIGGVGSVIVFVPNILLLYFFIAFLEGTGYMARAAFIMDKVMHKMGLHGRSFIPLLMGFGCNVPAILASRTIEGRNNRILTILINPLMSCSARLMVYLLFAEAFFPDYGSWVIVSIYLIGILLAVGIAQLFKLFFFRKETTPFVMELPPYRLPTLKATSRHMWGKVVQYIRKMGGIILVASIIVWLLGYFPRQTDLHEQHEQQTALLNKKLQDALTNCRTQEEKTATEATFLELQQEQQRTYQATRQKYSYIGRIGQFIEPCIEPLGLNWKAGIGLISGIAGKEIVISSLGVIYNLGETVNPDEKKDRSLVAKKIQADTWERGKHKGESVFTPLVAFTYMLFMLIYFPCTATVVAIKNETGSWKWALLSIFYSTGLAWIMAFACYQIGSLLIS